MATVPLLSDEEAPAESLAVFEAIRAARGTDYVNNFWRALAHDPALVHRFYDGRRAGLAGVEPNAAHRALARLDRDWPGGLLVVTQNVDGLHQQARGLLVEARPVGAHLGGDEA